MFDSRARGNAAAVITREVEKEEKVKTRSRATLCLTMAILGAIMLSSAIGCATGSATEVTIFTGGTGGTYFPLGSRYAELLNEYGDDIDASAVTSGASVTNCRAIGTGECRQRSHKTMWPTMREKASTCSMRRYPNCAV